MKIAHKFPAELNRKVTLDGVAYAFVPADPNDPASPHVAEVTNEDHIQRFLSITEGYRIYSDTTASRPAPVVPPPPAPPAPPAPVTTTPAALVNPPPQGESFTGSTETTGGDSQLSAPVVAQVESGAVATAMTTPNGDGASSTGDQSTGSQQTGDQGDQGDQAKKPDAELTAEQKEQAANLNGLSWQALKAQTNKGGIPQPVLKEALAIELRKPEVDQRDTAIKILKSVIKE